MELGDNIQRTFLQRHTQNERISVLSLSDSDLVLNRLSYVWLVTPWNFPGKNTGVGCHSFLREILPIQGRNPGLLHCRRILYCQPPGKLKERLYKNAIFYTSLNHHWLVTATMDVSVIAVPEYLFG